MSLINYTDEQLVRLVKERWITTDDLVNAGICPICFNEKHGNVLVGDRLLYEDEDFTCFLVDKPRADGHVIVSTKKHYNDMLEIDSFICQNIFLFAQKVMKSLKEIYDAENIYMCCMSDEKHSHFQIQLIPVYSYDKVGTYNFTKPRKEYFEDKEILKKIKLLINE